MYICVEYMWVSGAARGGLRQPLGSLVVVSHMMRMLGTELRLLSTKPPSRL